MPLTLLDGSNAATDITFATNSAKCITAAFSAQFVRDFTEKTTLCSSGWKSRNPGMRQLVGRLSGFASSGDPISNPAALMASTASIAIVLTITTGCTHTFQGHVGSDGTTIVAALNSGRDLSFESDGAVTTAWVVA